MEVVVTAMTDHKKYPFIGVVMGDDFVSHMEWDENGAWQDGDSEHDYDIVEKSGTWGGGIEK